MLIDLQKWCKKNDAINRSIEKLWICIEMYKKEHREEFNSIFNVNKENIKLYLSTISYEIALPDYDEEIISIAIDISINDKEVGWFKQQYCIDGSEYDEFFVIE